MGNYKRIYPTQNGDTYNSLVKHTHKTIMKSAQDRNQLTTYKLHQLLSFIEAYNLRGE